MSNLVGPSWTHLPPEQERLFYQQAAQALQQLGSGQYYFADNLLAWFRNLSFQQDAAFMQAYDRHAQPGVEKALLWRWHMHTWCVRQALRRAGDLVECGCYKGTSVRIACDAVGLGSQKKKFYLYDLFDHAADMPHHAMPEHGPGLLAQVQARFADLPQVKVIQGRVPEVLATQAPRKVAFLHVDLNHAEAEWGALSFFWPRMSPGSLILLDDYGWSDYRAQQQSADRFFQGHGLQVLELPTGQGLVVV